MADLEKIALASNVTSVSGKSGQSQPSAVEQQRQQQQQQQHQQEKAHTANGKSKDKELVRFPPCVVHSLHDISAMTGEAGTDIDDKMASAATNGGVDNGEPYEPQRTPSPPSSPLAGPAAPPAQRLWCMARLSNWISWVLERGFFK